MADTNCDPWDGKERRLAGNYPGRTAIILDKIPIPAATTVVSGGFAQTAAPEIKRLRWRKIQRQPVQSEHDRLLQLIQKRRTR